SPGHCWPFQGAQSQVLIRLPSKIEPKAVILQHSPNRASPMETISSAPQDFTVSGLDEESKEETLLGTFTYMVWKKPTQTFLLQNGSCKTFCILKLVIWSSWGQSGHTCIYRVKVQGKSTGPNPRSQLPS
ncbi:SUN2 protein, partial [Bucorvus abyssinicus]|nr:SUN2 protein [Bucorvus abyssinicus]